MPEPARSDYQILVDERADELVHNVMSKYRDQIWREMAEDRKTYTKDWHEMEQHRVDELDRPYAHDTRYYIDSATGMPVYPTMENGPEEERKDETPSRKLRKASADGESSLVGNFPTKTTTLYTQALDKSRMQRPLSPN